MQLRLLANQNAAKMSDGDSAPSPALVSFPRLRGKAGMGGSHQRSMDRFQHRLRLPQNVIIPEPQDAEIGNAQAGVSLIVVTFLLQMLAAVEFDYRSRL